MSESAPSPAVSWLDARETVLRGIDALRDCAEAGDVQAVFFVVQMTDGSYRTRCNWKRGTRPCALLGAVTMEAHRLAHDIMDGEPPP